CEHLGCVTHLSAFHKGMWANPPTWPGDLELLDGVARLTRLQSLHLEGCRVENWICDLLDNFSLPALVDLDLSGNRITDAGVNDLLRTHFPRRLRRLILSGNPITDAGAIVLAEQWPAGVADKLEKLNLRFTNIGQPGHQALLARFGGRVDLF